MTQTADKRHAAARSRVNVTASPDPSPLDLGSRGMLVDLNQSAWNAEKNDKIIGEEVAATHGNDSDMGRYLKRLAKDSTLDRVMTLKRRMYQEHRDRTRAWFDNGGGRVLLNSAYPDYVRVIGDLITETNEAVEVFVAEYPRIITDMRRALNGAFRESDYPGRAEIRSKFGFSYKVMPIPTAGDFRCLSGEELSKVQAQIERDTQDRIMIGQREIADRIKKVVGEMATTLRDYKPSEETGGRPEGNFQKTLVENVKRVAALLPSLNLTGDPLIDQMAADMQASLCKFSVDTLKTSSAVRQKTADAADAILAKMNDFI